MKIPKLEYLNINLKLFSVILSLTLIFLSFSFLNFHSIYSQSDEDEGGTICKYDQDQFPYGSKVSLVKNSSSVGPVTGDLAGFHYIKKFDREGNLIAAWGTKGIGPGQFLHAHGIAVDSKGYVYVSDGERCNIQKFDHDGNFIKMWGTKGTGPGQFLQPESIAIDSNENIFVADYSNQHILKFDDDGNFITMWEAKRTDPSQFFKPWGVAVDSKDDVYVSYQQMPLVQKFNNDGKFLRKWGSFGSGNGQFVHLHDITVDSKDFVYVTDGRNNSRVAKFDSEGNFITTWGSFGLGNGRFIEDHGIVIDPSGNAYVVDTRNVRIQKFDSKGNFITKWGSLGCSDDHFLIPHDIAMDSSGNIYVSDSGNVHFLAERKCQSLDNLNKTTSIPLVFTANMSGNEEVPPVDTIVKGHTLFRTAADNSRIKYKINITGVPDVTGAYIQTGKKGENGDVIVDLLKDSKKDKMKQVLGRLIRGNITDSNLIGSMKDKTLEEVIIALSDGDTYVNVYTPTYPKGEIRGQIKFER